MEKLKKNWSKEYPILRLYKDDVEEIFNIFKNNCDKFDTILDEYKINELSDISKITKKEVIDFQMNSYNPGISIRLNKYSSNLNVSDIDDTIQAGIFHKIDKILTKRKSILRILVSNWVIYVLTYLSFGIVILLVLFDNLRQDINKLLLGLLFLSLLLLAMKLPKWINHKLIYLKELNSELGFFRKNKELLYLTIIGAVLTSIVTYIIEKIFNSH